MQRFCQQCHRLHPLQSFFGDKHSCAARLQRFNAARREKRARRRAEAEAASEPEPEAAEAEVRPAAAVPPPPPSAPPALASVPAPTDDWMEALAVVDELFGLRFATEGEEAAWAGHFAPPGDDFIETLPPLELYSCAVKLPEASAAAELPPPPALGGALSSALLPGSQLASFSHRPGCLVLAMDVFIPAAAASDEQTLATRLAAALSVALGRSGAGGRVHVRDAVAMLRAQAAAPAQPARPPPPRPSLGALHLRAGGGELRVPLLEPAPPGCVPVARCSGYLLPASVTGGELVLSGWEALRERAGAMLQLEWQWQAGPTGHDAVFCISEPASLFLSPSAAAAAEVAALCGYNALPPHLRPLAAALPGGCALRLRVSAVSACLRLGLGACLALLLAPAGGPEQALADAGQTGTVALVALSVSLLPRLLAAARAAAERGLRDSGWWPLVSSAGWGGAGGGCRSAVAHAHALIRRAVEEQGHAVPLLAALAALDEAQSAAGRGCWQDAAALPWLRASMELRKLSMEIQEAEAGEEEAGAAVPPPQPRMEQQPSPPQSRALTEAMAADSERQLAEFFGRENASIYLFVGVMMLGGSFMMIGNCRRLVFRNAAYPDASQMPPYTGKILESIQLHPLAGGEPFRIQDVPWDVVVTHTRQYYRFIFFVLLPAQLCYLFLATRVAMCRVPRLYNTLFTLCSLLDLLGVLGVDLQAYRATGALLVWPLNPTPVLNAVGFVSLFSRGPFSKPACVIFYMIVRAVIHCAPALLLKPRLLLSAEAGAIYVQVLGCLVAIALVPRRFARMRASFLASKAKKEA